MRLGIDDHFFFFCPFGCRLFSFFSSPHTHPAPLSLSLSLSLAPLTATTASRVFVRSPPPLYRTTALFLGRPLFPLATLVACSLSFSLFDAYPRILSRNQHTRTLLQD